MRVILQDFRYGRIMRPGGDSLMGAMLALYGEYCPNEVDTYWQLVRPGDTVLDIGASIGATTVPLAEMVGPEGRVYAFEPQRVMHQMLCGNLMLNNLMNVYALNVGIGAKKGAVKISDAFINPNMVSGSIGNFAIAENPGDYEVEIIPVDELNLSRCDFIKCDTEGMGLDMLQGAEKTIRKHRPILWIEAEYDVQGRRVVDFLRKLNYRVYVHNENFFKPGNFMNETRDFFVDYRVQNGVVGLMHYGISNWMCIPDGGRIKKVDGFAPVE